MRRIFYHSVSPLNITLHVSVRILHATLNNAITKLLRGGNFGKKLFGRKFKFATAIDSISLIPYAYCK